MLHFIVISLLFSSLNSFHEDSCPNDKRCLGCVEGVCAGCQESYAGILTGICREPTKKVENCMMYSSNGVCETCIFGYRPVNRGRECVRIEQEYCAKLDSNNEECFYCNKGILIDSRGRCNPDNRCRMTGCNYCYLDDNNEERCMICEAPYIRVFPYNRCIREDGTEK